MSSSNNNESMEASSNPDKSNRFGNNNPCCSSKCFWASLLVLGITGLFLYAGETRPDWGDNDNDTNNEANNLEAINTATANNLVDVSPRNTDTANPNGAAGSPTAQVNNVDIDLTAGIDDCVTPSIEGARCPTLRGKKDVYVLNFAHNFFIY